MSGFAGLFALAGQFGEVGGFLCGALGNVELVIGGESPVVETGDGGDQAAAGDFQFCSGHGGSGIGAAYGRNARQAQRFFHNALRNVLPGPRVVGDEFGIRRSHTLSALRVKSVRLCVDALAKIACTGQQPRARN